MSRLAYLLTHISIHLRLSALVSSCLLFVIGILMGLFSWAGFIVGSCCGLLFGFVFWLETRVPLYEQGQFPVTATQKGSYAVLFFMYSVFLGCVIERFLDAPSPAYVETILKNSFFGALGFLIFYTLVQLARLSVFTLQGGTLDRFIWRERQTGKEGMVGLTGVVTERLEPEGKIRVRGEIWTASLENGEVLDPGSKVLVEEIDGLVLRVRPCSKKS